MGSSVSLSTWLLKLLLWVPYGGNGSENAIDFQEVACCSARTPLATWLHLAQEGLGMSVAGAQEVKGRQDGSGRR